MSEGKKEILLGDCLELMKDIPNGSVDMILCDLPYGTTACKWDTIIPFDKLWQQYERIIKQNGAIVLTASQPFTTVMIGSNLKLFKYELIWQKTKCGSFQLAKSMPMKYHENICVFYKQQPTYNPQWIKASEASISRHKYNFSEIPTRGLQHMASGVYKPKQEKDSSMAYPRSIIEFKNERKNYHPTEKPIGLFEWIIKTYTNEGDLVLDNTAGSGTTAIACLNTNRQFIVMEKEQKYYDIILKRVGDFNKKFETQTLFGNEM